MKKTVIAIVLLGTLGIPISSYGRGAETPGITMDGQKKETSIISVFNRLSKSTKVPFLYSSSDFKGFVVDDSGVNYSSLEASLRYLKTKYSIEYEVKNNTVVVRKGKARAMGMIPDAVH